MEEESLIYAMFGRHVPWKPRDYQVASIHDLCFDDASTLVVKGTGEGKTWTLLGSFLLRCGAGGVAVVVVPTIALGASAARSAQIKLPNAFCLHVNGLTPDQQTNLASMIKRPGLDKPFLLYFSADRVANKDWKPAIAEATTAGNIKLVCFDEVHTYHLSDYRPENKLLWDALVRPVLQANRAFPSRDKTPILAMTATLDEYMLKDLEASILKTIFTRRHWGDDAYGVMPRRNIKMAFSMRDSTQSIQRIADHVLAFPVPRPCAGLGLAPPPFRRNGRAGRLRAGG